MTELERRDTPAWWAVAAPTVPEGTPGSTDATTTGSLTLNPEYRAVNGVVTVWADGPVQAAGLGLAGTMNSKYADHDLSHAFVQENIGDDPSDHKAFLVVVNAGGGVDVLFEDMAGDPDADYDYNDRQWGDLPLGGTGDPVDTEDTWTWANGDTGESVTVHLKVTEPSPDAMLWHYDVTNKNFSVSSPEFRGVGAFGVNLGDPAALSKRASGQADWVLRGPAVWQTPDTKFGSVVVMGATGWFEFTTPPRPVVPATGFVAVASPWGFGQGATGPLEAPGVNDLKADIDIAGKIKVGVVETVFTKENEDTIGGLVLMNSNDNNAPRQQITIQPLTDAAGQPVGGGKVEVTWAGGRVELYDKATGGNKVPSGTVYANVAGVLPKQLWVQGVEGGGPGERGSGAMRDVKIKATPVGNPAGADDVSFTVLWVDVVVATSGYISDNNDKRDHYTEWTELGTSKLGLQRYNSKYGARMGWGVEARGAVSPSDFAYPGSNLKLERDIETRYYIAEALVENGTVNFSKSIPGGNDTGSQDIQDQVADNNPLDSNGFIYNFDAPGMSYYLTPLPIGTTQRTRKNHSAFASIAINNSPFRPSGIYTYFFRLSARRTGNGFSDWDIIKPSDIAGDNTANGPARTKLTIEVQ